MGTRYRVIAANKDTVDARESKPSGSMSRNMFILKGESEIRRNRALRRALQMAAEIESRR